jgi:subtilisin family serine protease
MVSRSVAFPSILVALVALLLTPPALAAPAQEGNPPYRKGEVIIKFRDNATTADVNAIMSDLGGTRLKHFQRINADHLRVSKFSTAQAVDRYKNNPKVVYIEPNFVWKAVVTPNDPSFPLQWSLENTGQTGGVPGADIKATAAWGVSTGSDSVIVAVIDTGVDYNHVDLAENIWTNLAEQNGLPGVDDDGNGYIDDIHGYNFAYGIPDPMDDNGHGTHCSGTIGAVGNNGVGVTGVTWRVRIMAVKFLDSFGSGSSDGAIAAIDYATSNGARVLSNSWGGDAFSQGLLDAIERAREAGVVFVAAAGNASANVDVTPFYPAAYPSTNIVSVAASDPYDQLASFSNYGATTVDLAAPGVDILSTFPFGSYAYLSGTSMACPHVSGALALLLSTAPGLTPEAMRQLLITRGNDPEPAFAGKTVSGGRLNLLKLVSEPDSIPPGSISNLTTSDANGSRIDLHWTATGDDGSSGQASAYEIRRSSAPITPQNFDAATPVPNSLRPQPAGSSETFRVTGLSFTTTYYFALRALDEYSNRGPVSNGASGTTLGPPSMSVSPGSFEETLLTGQTVSRPLTVSNAGPSELQVRFAAKTSSIGALVGARLETRVPRPAAPARALPAGPVLHSDVAYDHGARPRRDRIMPAEIKRPTINGSSTHVLIVQSGSEVSEIQYLLASFSDLPVVDVFDAETEVPSTEVLADYDAVLLVANRPFGQGAMLGDRLADFADSGGGVVMTLATFIQGWNLEGRFLNDGYMPFLPGYGPIGSSSLGTFDPLHPIMQGVSFVQGDLLGAVELAPGAIGVANWAFGYPFVATQGANVAAVNIFVGVAGYWVGDVPLVLHNALVWANHRARWLSADPPTAAVPAGTSLGVAVKMDATGLDGGDYSSALIVDSDDPAHAHLELPALLHVIGAPDLLLSRTSIDFGSLFIGLARAESLIVSNPGSETLNITQITLDNPHYQVTPTTLSLLPRHNAVLDVRYVPATVGPDIGHLTLYSNDPDEGVVVVDLTGTAVPPPDIEVHPDSVSVSLLSGQTTTRTLEVWNYGTTTLDYQVAIVDPALASAVHTTVRTTVDVVGAATPVSLSSLGPGGPPMQTTVRIDPKDGDMPDRGAAVTRGALRGAAKPGVQGEEIFGAPNFQFIGGPRTRGNIFMCTTSTMLEEHRFFLGPLAVSQLWFLVYEGQSQTGAYTLVSASNMTPVPPIEGWYSSGPVNVPMIAGRFYIVCASFDAPSTYYNDQLIAPYPISASFGALIAGAGWDWAPSSQFPPDTMQMVPPEAFGSPVAYYQAIVTGLGTSWLTADPTSGSIPPGAKQDVTLTIDSDELIGGDYRADVRFTSNDPDEPITRVPVKLHVIGVPDLATVESQLDFPTTFLGLGSSLDLHIANRGTATLDITSIDITGDFFEFPTSLSIAARDSASVTVVFVPQAAGPRTGTLTLHSNDPDQPTLTIPLQGLGLSPPIASVSPTSVSASLVQGEKVTKTVRIQNNGGSPLTYDLVLRTLGFKAPTPSLTAGTDAAGAIGAPDAGIAAVTSTGNRISTIGATPIAAGADATYGTNAVVTVGAPRARVDGQSRHKPVGASGLYPGFHNRLVAIPGQVVVFYDSMEQGANGWVFQNYGPDSLATWHQTQRAYNSPTHSWWCGVESQGDYNTGNEVNMAVVSPPIDLRSVQTPVTLEFYENFETESGWDFCMVDASVDGSNWVPLRGGLHEAPSGSSGGWRNSAVDLSAFAGHITYLRFYFDTIDPVANAYPGWFFDDVLVTAAGVPWLTATPLSGEIAPGDGVNVQLDIDATGLALGSYGAEIVINSNDPVHPQLGVQVALEVVTQPALAVPDTFDVGDVYIGYPVTASLPVKNLGTQTLIVTNIAASGAGFSVTPTTLSVAPLDSVPVGVRFAPTAAGPRTGLLVFTSNDPSSPDSVVLIARGLPPPIARLTPGDITASMPPNGHGSAIVSLFNDGGSDLTYFARVASVVPGDSVAGPAGPAVTGIADATVASTRSGMTGRSIASEAVAAVVDAATPAPDPVALGSGVGSGYAWKDSDDPSGPAFAWVDIRSTGTPIPFPAFAEDDNVGPLPIGFSFPFYSGSFSSFRACVNGWVSFTSTATTAANASLPSNGSGVPENLIAPLWDDLIFDGTLGSKAWYRSDGSRLVIQYENLFRSFLPQVAGQHGAGTEAIPGLPPTYTFEIILDSNGGITFQYYELGNITTGATIGAQNATRTAGLQIAYNQAYLHAGLAIRMEPPPPPWVVFPPTGGTVAPGAARTLALEFDATGLAEGTYRAQLLVETNDPAAPQLTRDIVLTVEQPIIGDLQIQPRVLNPGRNGQWIRGDLQLPVGSSLQDVVIASVRMNGVVPANLQDFTFQVEEGNGRPTLSLKFDRGATMNTLPPGSDSATFVLTGGLTTGQHFVATDRIQVTGHHLTAPNGGEQIVALSNYLVSWSVPSDWPIEQATIDLSWNGGVTWQNIGQSAGSSWMWTVPAQTGNDVRLRVTLSDAYGMVSQDVSDASFQIVAPVADADIASIGAVALRQNQPNPFRSGTGIRFELPRSVPIRLVVFDLAGRSVRTLAQGSWPAGKHQISWDGTDDRGVRLRAGVYVYRLEAEEFSSARRMSLLE